MNDFKLKGSKNVRDLGGIPVFEGQVKPLMLLRGGHLQKLTRKDCRKLKNAVGVKTVIDLRTDKERARKPDTLWAGVNYLTIPLFNHQIDGISYGHPEKRIPSVHDIPDLKNLYPALVKGEYCENLKQVVRTIMNLKNDELPVLFHCTEGKDRTGIVSMVLLSLMGASREEIMRDYMETNTAVAKRARRLYRLVRWLKLNKPAGLRLQNVMLAKEEYLNETYHTIEENWKTVERFLHEAMGITEEEQAAFRKRMTVQTP